MRMRRKKNLEPRVEESDNLLYREPSFFYKREDKEYAYKLDLKEAFGNDNPVVMEIGCGKGGCLKETALAHPELNFLGVERITNVIISALENGKGVKNLKFLNCDAQNLVFFLEKNSIEKILLNFSCPFPKKQYANRRLTNGKFLEIYKKICVPNFTIEQKTDSLDFFEYSLFEYAEKGFEVVEKTYDLYSESGFEEQKLYKTEFEKNFVEQGKPVRYVKVLCK